MLREQLIHCLCPLCFPFPDGSLGYVSERRVDRTTVRVIVKRDLETNAETDLSPPDWPVTDWAVARDGQTFAIVIQESVNDILTQGMWIVRITSGVVTDQTELPRATELEQFLFPSFRW